MTFDRPPPFLVHATHRCRAEVARLRQLVHLSWADQAELEEEDQAALIGVDVPAWLEKGLTSKFAKDGSLGRWRALPGIKLTPAAEEAYRKALKEQKKY